MGSLQANVAGVWEPAVVPVGFTGVTAVVAGPDTTVDATNPANPVITGHPVNEVTVAATAPTDTSELWATVGGAQVFSPRYGWAQTANPGVPTTNFVFDAKVTFNNDRPPNRGNATGAVSSQWLVHHATPTTNATWGFTFSYTGAFYASTNGDDSVTVHCGAGSCFWRIPFGAWPAGVDMWIRVTVPVGTTVATMQWSSDGVTYTAPMNSTASSQPLVPVDPGAPLTVGSGFGYSTLYSSPRVSWRGLVYWAQVATTAAPATPLWRADATEVSTPYETSYTDPRGRAWTIAGGGLRLPNPASLSVRNGGAWDRVGASTAALDRIDAIQTKINLNPAGIVAVGSFTFGDGVYLTPGAALTNPLALTAYHGHWYRFCMSFRAALSTADNSMSMSLYRDGVYVTDRYQQVINGLFQNMTVEYMIQTPNSGNYTVNCNYAGGSITGYSVDGHWYIQDFGADYA